MRRRPGAGTVQTYLVEHYQPGLTVDGLMQWAGRIRDAAGEMEREGRRVRYLSSTIVPADESLLCVLEGASEELVRELYGRAGIPFERISAAVNDDGWVEARHADDGCLRAGRRDSDRKEI